MHLSYQLLNEVPPLSYNAVRESMAKMCADNRAVLFDLDGTLLRTSELVRAVFHQLPAELVILLSPSDEDHHFSAADLLQWHEEYKATLSSNIEFDPKQLCDFWHRRLTLTYGSMPLSGEQLFEAFNQHIRELTKSYLFPDVLRTLETMHRQQTRIGLFTQGVITWQEIKFAHADIAAYFQQPMQFMSSHKTEPKFLANIAETLNGEGITNLWIIDDSPDVLFDVDRNWPKDGGIAVTRVWINRSQRLIDVSLKMDRSNMYDEKKVADFTVPSLEVVLQLLADRADKRGKLSE